MSRPRQISDEQIAAAARKCFVEHGPGVATTVISDALGVSQAALFKRVGSKEELFLRALCPGEPAWVGQLAAGPNAKRPLKPQLKALLTEMLAFFREVLPGLVVLRSSGTPLEKVFPPDAPSPPLLARQGLAGWLQRAARQKAVARVDFSAVADTLIGALEARCFLAHIGGTQFIEGEEEEFVARIIEATWHGLAPLKGSKP